MVEAEPAHAPARDLYTGQAVGGPANGLQLESRFPAGLLLVDRPTTRVWIYDYTPGPFGPTLGTFQTREPEGRVEDVPRRWAAALGEDYDVLTTAALPEGSQS